MATFTGGPTNPLEAHNSPGSEEAPSNSTLKPEADRRYAQYWFRQTTSIAAGTFAGLILGMTHSSQMAALRFRAENAHRLPTSTKGWYLYHKSKNYVSMWAGLKGGGRSALKMGFWAGAFVAVEESIERMRHGRLRRDADDSSRGKAREETADGLSSVVAGLAIAGGFSAWSRFPLPTAAKTARLGLVFGAVYGALQDVWRLGTGRKVSYVKFVKRRVRKGENAGAVGT